MHILMIHPHDLLTEPWTIRIIKYAESLVHKGHKVTLAYFPSNYRRKEGLIVRDDLPGGMSCIELKRGKWNLIGNMKKVLQLAESADIIHVQKCIPDAALPALYAARFHNKPLHYDWDDNETWAVRYCEALFFTRTLIALYERVLPGLSTTVSVTSEILHQMALARGAHADRIVRATVGVDIQEFDSMRKSACPFYPQTGNINHWILYVGQLEAGNFGQLIISSFREVVKVRKDIGLLIVGGGFAKAEFENRISALNLADNVFFTGYVPHKNIPSIMAKADIGLACVDDAPLARAGSPIKVLEYMASGLAVVGTAVGEIPQMLEGCGMLVGPGDLHAVRDAVLELIDNPEKRRMLGEKARRRVSEVYNWDRITDNLLEAYNKGIAFIGSPAGL